MLPSSRRLTSAEVPLILKVGKGASFGPIRVKYTYRTGRVSTSRFAVVVSKKVLKKAVDRNRVRRRVYSAVSAATFPRPVDAVVLLSSGALSGDELRLNVRGALSKVQ